jgi:hypothetical protein
MKKIARILILLFGWLVLIGVHFAGVYFSFYEVTWWLDIFMHTLGGFLVVTSWYQVKSLNAFPAAMSYWWFQPLIILIVMMVVWELFELSFGLIAKHDYLIDTAADFFNGFSGGLVSFLLFRSRTIGK